MIRQGATALCPLVTGFLAAALLSSCSGARVEGSGEAESGAILVAVAEYALRAWPAEMRTGAVIRNAPRNDEELAPLDRVEAYTSTEHSASFQHWLAARGVRLCRVERMEVCPDVVSRRPFHLVAIGYPRQSPGGTASTTVFISSVADGRYTALGYDLDLQRSGRGWSVTGRRLLLHEH